MLGKLWGKVSLFIFLLIIMSACSISEERVLERAQASFEEKIVQEKKPAAYESGIISLYVPSFTEITSEDDFNIIMERNNHTFLLFLKDRTNYQTDVDILEEQLVDEEPFIFEVGEGEDGEQGYLVVTHYEDGHYKLVVGYNGAKITTITTLSEMNDVAEILFDIVQSIQR